MATKNVRIRPEGWYHIQISAKRGSVYVRSGPGIFNRVVGGLPSNMQEAEAYYPPQVDDDGLWRWIRLRGSITGYSAIERADGTNQLLNITWGDPVDVPVPTPVPSPDYAQRMIVVLETQRDLANQLADLAEEMHKQAAYTKEFISEQIEDWKRELENHDGGD